MIWFNKDNSFNFVSGEDIENLRFFIKKTDNPDGTMKTELMLFPDKSFASKKLFSIGDLLSDSRLEYSKTALQETMAKIAIVPFTRNDLPLMVASWIGSADKMRELLKDDKRLKAINNKISGGITLLFQAAQDGYEDVIEVLLENGANPNIPRENDLTCPLYIALEFRHIGVANKILDSKKVDFRFLGNSVSPLEQALIIGNLELVRKILAANILKYSDADTKAKSLCIAAGEGNVEILKLLLDAGIDPNASLIIDKITMTPILAAVDYERFEAVKFLLSKPPVKLFVQRNKDIRNLLVRLAFFDGNFDIANLFDLQPQDLSNFFINHTKYKEGFLQIMTILLKDPENLTANFYKLINPKSISALIGFVLDKTTDPRFKKCLPDLFVKAVQFGKNNLIKKIFEYDKQILNQESSQDGLVIDYIKFVKSSGDKKNL